jgi:hypothetical protein
MRHVTRTDRIIGIALVAVLLALFGLGLARRPAQASSTVATTASGGVASALGVGVGVGVGGPSSATVPLPTAPPTTSTSPSATSTTSTTSSVATTTTVPAVTGPISAVGDSIMIDIQPYLQADLPGVSVDGVVSRQFETGIGVVQADRAAGTLGSVLIVELGTNGSVTSSDFDAMMQAAAGVKRVVFVNLDVPRPWEAPDNAVLAAGVARYPGVAVLADWYTLSTPHPEWFTPDQVHLEPAGAQAMAALIAQDA